jgi:hypothetical protein
VILWLLFHAQIGGALRDLTVAIGRPFGVPLLVRGPAPPGRRPLRDDEIGILSAKLHDGQWRAQRYVMTLTRWHANLVVLPPLALSVGRLSATSRFLMLAIGLPALLFLDALATLVYLLLAQGRVAGTMFVAPVIHRNLSHGLAVVGLKLLPIALWGVLYLLLRRREPAPSVHQRSA